MMIMLGKRFLLLISCYPINCFQVISYLIVLGPVHTTPEEFENGALFLRLGLPSTLIRTENGAFRKRRLCVLVWTKNILKTKLFENDDVTIIMIFPSPSFTQTQIQNTADCCVFKFLRRNVDGKHLMRFQSETSVFKFFRRSVDGA